MISKSSINQFMFVRKIKSNKGIKEVGRFGIDRIDVTGDIATLYTAGGNIFTVRCLEILNADKVVSNSHNHHKKSILRGYFS